MGQFKINDRTKMKAFMIAALAGLAAAAPSPLVASHAVISGHGALVSHGTHAVHGAPLVAHGGVAVAHAAPVLAHPLTHAVHRPVLAHAAPVLAHPLAHAVHAAPVISHAPVVAHAVHAAPAYPEVEEPYSYQYGVADDYSKANFNAAETADANGVVSGSYDVSLPDGRIQHVKYTSDNYNGYVADVSYEGTPVYPEAKPYAPVVAAPAYHA